MIDFDAIRQRHSLVDVAARYVDLRAKGSEYVAHCPLHADGDPSLTLFKGRDGLYRWRCFPCAAGGDVIDFVQEVEGCSNVEAAKRLDGGDLPPISTVIPVRDLPPDESDVWEPIVPAPADAPAYDPARTYNPKRGKFVAYRPKRTDPYLSADGAILCYVVRLEIDGHKLTPVITWCDGPGGPRWCAKRMRPPYPLQGLDQLAARPGAKVVLVSGEKCYAAARQHLPAFVAVSWMGGDGAVDHADVSPLAGRDVTYWPDADPSGQAAIRRMYERVG